MEGRVALEIVLGVPLLLVLLLLVIALRHRGLARSGGTVELSLRTSGSSGGRGWANGIGRFVDDELQFFRVFSLSARPRRTLSRRELEVTGRRAPDGVEQRALHEGAVVLCCRSGASTVELALQPSAVTGFLAWLEARPPGATMPA